MLGQITNLVSAPDVGRLDDSTTVVGTTVDIVETGKALVIGSPFSVKAL
jgi:hypothetical protein